MIAVRAPQRRPEGQRPILFLAGSIDEGRAEPWQDEVAARLRDLDVVILNPRRRHWHPEWVQSIDNPLFAEQVEWELEGLEEADLVLMFLIPGTRAPISLLELGLRCRRGGMVVVCPEGFWRKGNVDMVCQRYGIEQRGSLQDGIDAIRGALVAAAHGPDEGTMG